MTAKASVNRSVSGTRKQVFGSNGSYFLQVKCVQKDGEGNNSSLNNNGMDLIHTKRSFEMTPRDYVKADVQGGSSSSRRVIISD